MGSNSRTGFELAEGGEENYSLLEKKSVAITVIWPISGCDAALEVLQYHSLRQLSADPAFRPARVMRLLTSQAFRGTTPQGLRF